MLIKAEKNMTEKSKKITPSSFDEEVLKWEGDLTYFNGFSCGLGIGDIILVLKRNNKNVAVLNTSYTVAKTLVDKLNGIITDLEKKAKTTILTTDEITSAMTGASNDEPKH